MNVKQTMKHFGCSTQTELAAALEVSQPCIANWIRRGDIPQAAQRRIGELSNGALRVSKPKPKQ